VRSLEDFDVRHIRKPPSKSQYTKRWLSPLLGGLRYLEGGFLEPTSSVGVRTSLGLSWGTPFLVG
jgi:hypothetical protein